MMLRLAVLAAERDGLLEAVVQQGAVGQLRPSTSRRDAARSRVGCLGDGHLAGERHDADVEVGGDESRKTWAARLASANFPSRLHAVADVDREDRGTTDRVGRRRRRARPSRRAACRRAETWRRVEVRRARRCGQSSRAPGPVPSRLSTWSMVPSAASAGDERPAVSMPTATRRREARRPRPPPRRRRRARVVRHGQITVHGEEHRVDVHVGVRELLDELRAQARWRAAGRGSCRSRRSRAEWS